MHRLITALVVLPLVAGMLGCGGKGSSSSSNRPVVAVIPKGTTHEFWKSIHAGAVKASQGGQGRDHLERALEGRRPGGADLGGGGLREPGGIRHRPRTAGRRRTPPPVANADRAGIPVVIIDSDLKGEDYRQFRGHGQLPWWNTRGRAPDQGAERQGNPRDAPLPGRFRQHHQSRAGIPGRDREGPRDPRGQPEPVRGGHDRDGVQVEREPAGSPQEPLRGSFRWTRSSRPTSPAPSGCSARCRTEGLPGTSASWDSTAPPSWWKR